MISVVRAAAKGERKAMQSLYKANKQTVWSVAQGLLLDQEQSATVTASVFRDLLRDLKRNKIDTKEDFTNVAIRKTAEQCVAIILKKRPKAFQLPHDKDFRLAAGTPIIDHWNEEPEFYLSNLPPLLRLIFILHTIGGWGALRIAQVLQWDSALIRSSIETEAYNFKQLQKLSGRNYSAAYEEILLLFQQWKSGNALPADLDRDMIAHIESQVSPQAESAKRTKLSILLFCAIICLALLPFIIQIAQRKAEEKAAQDSINAASDIEADINDIDDPDDEYEETEDEVTEPTLTYSPGALDSDVIYTAEIYIDGYDPILIQLDHHAAPVTCANFVEMALRGDYDRTTSIYSITDGSMIKGGDPSAISSSIITNKRIVGEFSENGYDNPLLHTAGAISLNRGNEYDSGYCSFSILREDCPDMDGKYAVFGYVIEGMEVLDEIYNDMTADEYGNIPLENQPIIDSIFIYEEDIELPEDDY